MYSGGNSNSNLKDWQPNSQGSTMLRDMVKGKIYSGDSVIEKKLTKYQLFWNFYNNEHWAENNDKLLSFNYVRAIIDKINNFMTSADGFELVITDTYGDQISTELSSKYEALLNYNWKKNSKITFLTKMLQMGGITGDVYIFLYPNEDKGYVEYRLMDTRTCIPQFRDGDYNDIIGYKIVQPLMRNDKNYTQKVFKYTKETTEIYFTKDTGDNAPKFELQSTTNTLGFIPIVHIENIPMADTYGGKSDVEDIVKLNKIYNEMSEDIKAVIDYYAQPTTVITGGTVGQLKRGINQIWSGLPSDANVFNLTLGEDLSASMNFLQMLKQAMHDLTGVPEEVLSKVQHISNTSASALQMLYQSLIQMADKKSVTYGEGIKELNRMTFLLFSQQFSGHPLYTRVKEQVESEGIMSEYSPELFTQRFDSTPKFKYALPSDRLQMLNEANIEVSMGIASRREVMERLGKSNINELMRQIEEDIEYKEKLAKVGSSGEESVKLPNENGGKQPYEGTGLSNE